MSVQERAAEAAHISTGADPSAIKAAADRAAEASKSWDATVRSQQQTSENELLYLVKQKIGITHLTFAVAIGAAGPDGRRRVTTKIVKYFTTQPKVAGFIPVGPKSIVGLRNYRHFMSNLEAQLAGL